MRPQLIPNLAFFAFLLISLALSTIYFGNIGLTDAWIHLNENQIMYLYSTSAQVLAAVYGLTLAGYIFFRGELNREAQDDATRVEVIEQLETRYFQQLAMITALMLGTIVVVNLVIAYENSPDLIMLTALMNLGQSLFSISFIAIAFFIVDIVLPGNIKAASKTLQLKLDPKHDEPDGQGSLKEFVNTYDAIENMLTLALSSLEVPPAESNSSRRMSSTKVADLLCRRGVIPRELFKKLHNLFALRHAIMHGADPTVSESMVTQSKTIFKELSSSLSIAKSYQQKKV